MLELIVNILLFLFFGYTLCFHVLEAPIPDKVARNPYALQPNIWPGVILVLLLILILVNIIKIYRANKGKPEFSLKAFGASLPAFFRSRMFFGILIVVIASYLLEPLGFMVTSFLLLVSYAILLGDRKWVRIVVVSLFITIALYICFGVLLSVNLPRGTVPFLRNMALFIESLLP